MAGFCLLFKQSTKGPILCGMTVISDFLYRRPDGDPKRVNFSKNSVRDLFKKKKFVIILESFVAIYSLEKSLTKYLLSYKIFKKLKDHQKTLFSKNN